MVQTLFDKLKIPTASFGDGVVTSPIMLPPRGWTLEDYKNRARPGRPRTKRIRGNGSQNQRDGQRPPRNNGFDPFNF